MAQRMGGPRRKTRQLMRKSLANKGKISITKYFQKFENGQRVQLVAEPAVHNGMFPLNFYAKPGVISGMQGKCYKVTIRDGGKDKCIIVHPVHLKKI